MIFDDKYSDCVSLSKILDCFLEDEDEPSVILTFLSEYSKTEIQDIFSHSLCLPRMLSLGFVYKCTAQEIFTIIDYVTVEDTKHENYELHRLYAYFLWQILKSKLPEVVKSKARDSIVKLTTSTSHMGYGRIKHPHIGSVGRRMSDYDFLFVEHPEEEENVIKALGRMDIGDFTDYMENLSHSLWFMRMFQIDVFESFDIQKQYIFLTKTFMDNANLISFSEVYFGFFRQLLSSNVDIEIKKMVYEQVKKINRGEDYLLDVNTEVYNMLHSGMGKEELIMTMQLYGIDRYAEPVIMYFLLSGNEKTLIWMYENCPDIIKESIDISELIETWMKEDEKN